jgi:hypothetical protein
MSAKAQRLETRCARALRWLERGAASAKTATRDQQRYGYCPVLLETFVESPRHRGTCYKAANWIDVAQTVKRGKKSLVHQQVLPVKDIRSVLGD